jgi:uncharacterized protein (DUF924 family)
MTDSAAAIPKMRGNGSATQPSAEMIERRDAVLKFWFGTTDLPADAKIQGNFALWFGGSPETDATITELFKADVEKAARGDYFAWLNDPRSALALIILLDQFSLNVYRDQPQGYEVSARAIPYAYTVVGRGFDMQVAEAARMFLYLPLEHSEEIVDQELCVEWHKRGGIDPEFAVIHRDVVAKYGRFPGRNAVYGRESTAAEKEYIANGGEF